MHEAHVNKRIITRTTYITYQRIIYTTIGPVRPGFEPIINLIKRIFLGIFIKEENTDTRYNKKILEYKQKKEET